MYIKFREATEICYYRIVHLRWDWAKEVKDFGFIIFGRPLGLHFHFLKFNNQKIVFIDLLFVEIILYNEETKYLFE